ncbi:nitrogen fixation negative regulator NifL [Reinekea marinisedimentorum]|uniref:histidine kinase n=1 Tax=Reinekea marinisedimentorum TaxID=230495 RepID=A0A4R3I1J5_9GAMM|nr:nitrogen fixation negative regulator NifL [Reinekea marinisedimentorum]TCS38883.1 nitrogen fixation negative regulator NifL [Reinekea marinisedimentorum]
MIDLFQEAKTQLETMAADKAHGLFSLEQVKQIVNSVPMAVSITDNTGTILYVNDYFTKITGYSTKELIGQNHAIISYRMTPQMVYEELWSTITRGKPWSGQLLNKRKSGESYLAEVQISPLQGSDTSGKYYLGVHRDISNRHALETAQNNSEQLVSSVLNSVPTAVALLNTRDEVMLHNRAYQMLEGDLQKSPAILAVQKIKEQCEISSIHTVQAESLLNKSILIDFDHFGQKRFFVCRISGLEMKEENIDNFFAPVKNPHIVLSLTDITREQKRLEQQRLAELQRSTVESEMMHAMQETMHAVLHQLQEPVNMIESAIGLLKNNSSTNSGLPPMNMALEAGKKAVQQLRDALPERPYEARQSVNLNQLVHEIAEMSNERLLKRSIDLRLSLVTTLPSITAQPSRLRVAIKQLLDNAIDAIDYSKSSTREILISTGQAESEIVLKIEDSGPGIKKSEAIKVFQPFYTTKPISSEGSRGIGLSIVQQVMNEHCGTVHFTESSLGGSCAHMSLPKRQEA